MLTPKQEKFCQCIVSGMSGKDSYYAAYDTQCNENTASREAMKLLEREDVQARLTELRKPLENHARTVALTDRERKREFLWKVIADENQSMTDRLRGVDLLNKMDSEYTQVNVNENRNSVTFDNLDLEALKTLSDGV